MQIGELAKRAGSQPETVRYYERLGLLPPPGRTEGNYRLYEEWHLERLRFIRNCRSIGMTLGEVRRLLDVRDRPDLAGHEIDQLLDTLIAQLKEQLRDLHHLERYLCELRSWCESARSAGDMEAIGALTVGTPSSSSGVEPS